ncbi:hypothetical protein QBC46DRAFT_398961, partial [Diplogelasinospora grovesii]
MAHIWMDNFGRKGGKATERFLFWALAVCVHREIWAYTICIWQTGWSGFAARLPIWIPSPTSLGVFFYFNIVTKGVSVI